MLAARLPMAAACGVLASLALFIGLAQLIGERMTPLAKAAVVIPDFTRLRPDTPIDTKRPEKPPREPTIHEPVPPRPGVERTGDVTAVPPSRVEVVGPTGPGPTVGIDRDAVPFVRFDPAYPPREQARGITGFARVRFTVTAAGTVRDAVVVASEPPGAFDAAALEAVMRWRYNPRIEGGVAVERVGLETLFRFELD